MFPKVVTNFTVIQWAPTLTVHDPNPPITLESPAAGGVVGPLLNGHLVNKGILQGRLVA